MTSERECHRGQASERRVCGGVGEGGGQRGLYLSLFDEKQSTGAKEHRG